MSQDGCVLSLRKKLKRAAKRDDLVPIIFHNVQEFFPVKIFGADSFDWIENTILHVQENSPRTSIFLKSGFTIILATTMLLGKVLRLLSAPPPTC